MSLNRRALLQQLAAMAALGSTPALAQASRRRRRMVPWKNWSGAQYCLPAERLAPASEEELIEIILNSSDTIRPVGSGHSFSALVPTEDKIVSLAKMTGMISHDAASKRSRFWGGTPMSEMGDPLKEAGLALSNMADIDYQTLAGALATSTHGTGVDHGSYSTQVDSLRIINGLGEVVECDANNNPDIFAAGKVSLGALGFVSQVGLQNRDAFRLKESMWLEKTESLLERIGDLTAQNQHWEMQVITNSDYAASITLNETSEAATSSGEDEDEGGNAYLKAMEKLEQYAGDFPAMQRAILNLVAKTAGFEDRIADSYKIYANVRNVRFNEMEYSVPAEAGPDCLRDILKLIDERGLQTWFPIEYRYVQADDIPISMFEGRDSCALSIHQYYTMDYHNFFAAIEPIFWRYGGRPHWGKLHNLNARELKKLYPRWDEFAAAREKMDPKGRFLNAHLRKVLI